VSSAADRVLDHQRLAGLTRKLDLRLEGEPLELARRGSR